MRESITQIRYELSKWLRERDSGPSGDNGFEQTQTKSSIHGACAHSFSASPFSER